MTGRRARLVALAVTGLLVLLAPYLGLGTFYTGLLSQVWVLAIAAVGLDIAVGYTGLVSFAHGAIFGSGAYTVGILTVQFGITGFLPALALGICVSFVISVIFGAISLRTTGAAFIIITLALNQLLWGVAQQWTSFTGGDNGLVGYERPTFGAFSTAGITPFYYFSLAFLVITVLILRAFVKSPFGLTLVGVREEPERMEALGYNPWLHRFVAFLVGGVFAGLSGVLFAYYNLFVSPEQVAVGFSVQLLIMVFIGGRGTLYGPILGAVVVVVIANMLSGVTDRWQMLLGAFYIVVILFAKGGITGIAGKVYEKFRRVPRATVKVEES